jgi:hypothetical protein
MGINVVVRHLVKDNFCGQNVPPRSVLVLIMHGTMSRIRELVNRVEDSITNLQFAHICKFPVPIQITLRC